MPLTTDIRTACARVAARARFVRIVDAAIEPYAQTIKGSGLAFEHGARMQDLTPQHERAAASLTLNAINFGSGWFPTLRKPPGLSGFRTVEAGLAAHGPWPAGALAAIEAGEIATVLGQDPDHELMALFAGALRELGERVRDEHGGSFLELARSGEGAAVALAERLASWPGWRDVAEHDGELVPLFKRAQIAAADLHRSGVAPASDLRELTLFADNLVPHVLRLDGVLDVDPALVARIERGELLEHGSPEEVELRACAVHAAELLAEAHGATTAAELDDLLWNRGAGARYKAVPRHRARTTAY